MKFFAIIVFTSFISNLHAQTIRIGLYDRYEVKSYEFVSISGTYVLYADTTLSLEIVPGTLIKAETFRKDSIRLYADSKYYGVYSQVKLQQDSVNSIMQVQSTSPMIRKHTFRDNFEMRVREGKIILVNIAAMANYLAGVIESEGGGGKHLEYYKVQALISRTYALKNIDRHVKDGFNLCDAVHCQAYHNMMRFTPTILEAVKETSGEVFVDGNHQLMSTYFHANCGGQTSDASYVWKNSIPYCVPFVDTFCIHTHQSVWTKEISKSLWESFLRREYGLNVSDPVVQHKMYNFIQPYRKAFYIHPSLGIPLRDLRTEFKLKSTFFDVQLKGNSVLLQGRGFGHGVGLCQEGAMEMANSGYNYRQIGLFYFDHVRIIRYDQLLFYKEKIRENGL